MKTWISGAVGEDQIEVRVSQGPHLVVTSAKGRWLLAAYEARKLARALEDGARIAEDRDKRLRAAFVAARRGKS